MYSRILIEETISLQLLVFLFLAILAIFFVKETISLQLLVFLFLVILAIFFVSRFFRVFLQNSTDSYFTSEYQIGEYNVRTRSFCLYKKGGSQSEYEDRSAIAFQDACLRIAVADGTTEGLFSDIWADLLVKGYSNWGAALFEEPSLWSIHKEFIHQTYQQIAEMPEARHWAMYGKLERGTHATLAAIEFSAGKSVKMSAVGDSCIFWFSEGKIEMFPELNVEDFGISPDAICHLPETWQNLGQKVRTKEIKFEQSCQFVICTDAIAFWLLQESQENNDFSAWKKIINLSDETAFNQLVEDLRDSKKIRNDDVTLVIVDATFNV
ncbi:MAG: protein phosphatase 2C domain-containing protein [Hydrococcus sp. RU_2_2]|nr:protein phosphatase 2C domain-containing protein [Hydrococcus sp. RU_2_2]NJP19690.1 protein phosphatase 2C domain-containing protein [Hydrococcus sp. CRU_1_1]